MNKFDYQFKKRLEQHEVQAPEQMWARISSELNEENAGKGKVFSLGWAWKTATAAALVISIVSITLISLDRSSNSNGTQVSEVPGEVDGYGNGFEKPFFSADKMNVAFGKEEAVNEEPVATGDQDQANTPDKVSAPTYSMKILNEGTVESTEYEILGPDGSIDNHKTYLRLIQSASNAIANSTKEVIE